jgi:chromosome segregation ATPase
VTRQTKTPRQRAEEALGVAERIVKRLAAKKNELASDLRSVDAELEAAERRRDHLKAHPDLQQPTTSTGATK